MKPPTDQPVTAERKPSQCAHSDWCDRWVTESVARENRPMLSRLYDATIPCSCGAEPPATPVQTCVKCGHNNINGRGQCRQCIDWQQHICVFPAPEGGGEPKLREFDHFSIVPFKAICGANRTGQTTSQTPERVKCPICWQYFKEWESSRNTRASQPTPTTEARERAAVEIVEEVLDDWNGSYEHYALSGAPTGSAAKEQVNQFASEVINALKTAAISSTPSEQRKSWKYGPTEAALRNQAENIIFTVFPPSREIHGDSAIAELRQLITLALVAAYRSATPDSEQVKQRVREIVTGWAGENGIGFGAAQGRQLIDAIATALSTPEKET